MPHCKNRVLPVFEYCIVKRFERSAEGSLISFKIKSFTLAQTASPHSHDEAAGACWCACAVQVCTGDKGRGAGIPQPGTVWFRRFAGHSRMQLANIRGSDCFGEKRSKCCADLPSLIYIFPVLRTKHLQYREYTMLYFLRTQNVPSVSG